MKLLYLYSDWKWTGPAEPTLQMCKSLQDLGHEVLIANCCGPDSEPETVGKKVAQYGLNGTERFALDRYFHLKGTLYDIFNLPRFIAKEGFDIVHTHLSHDHGLGGFLTRLSGFRSPLVVRTLHHRTVLEDGLASRFLLRYLTDGCLCFTEGFREEYIRRFALDGRDVGVQPMTVDLQRFTPKREFKDIRKEFGIGEGAVVIGIVARFQKYRKMDLFLQAAKLVLDKVPNTRFLVIGRSSQIEETVIKPCRELGIEKQVILTGYRIDDYDDIIAGLDIFSLLIPGFDGTARAVREALALGKPCVCSDFGMLPDIVQDGKTGLIFEMRAESLAAAWLELINDRDRRLRMGEMARKFALDNFAIKRVGPCLEEFYGQLLQRKGRVKRG